MAHWIHEIAKQRTDLAFDLIDLRDHSLPFFNEPMSPAWAPAKNEAAQRWADKLATLDGLIVVTPEYNHGPSAVLKNAFDYAYKEFIRKPIGFVGYGGVGAARAIEQLRLVAIELQGRAAPHRHGARLDHPAHELPCRSFRAAGAGGAGPGHADRAGREPGCFRCAR